MQRWFKSLMSIMGAVLFVASASTFAMAATNHLQPGKLMSITGEVTPQGGLISNQCKPYLLYGSKAAGLRTYAKREVEVQGYKAMRGSNAVITVKSFKPVSSSHLALNTCSHPKMRQANKPVEMPKASEPNTAATSTGTHPGSGK